MPNRSLSLVVYIRFKVGRTAEVMLYTTRYYQDTYVNTHSSTRQECPYLHLLFVPPPKFPQDIILVYVASTKKDRKGHISYTIIPGRIQYLEVQYF